MHIVSHYVNSPPNKRFDYIDGFQFDFDLLTHKCRYEPTCSLFLLLLIPWNSKTLKNNGFVQTFAETNVFSMKVIQKNGPLVLWTFNDGDFFFRGAQVLCRQQLAFHLCDAVPAKSGA